MPPRKPSSKVLYTFNGPHIEADPAKLERYLGNTLCAIVDDIDVNTDHVHEVATWLTSPEARPWLLLTGNPGTGKSTMLRAIMWIFRVIGGEFKKFPASDLPAIFLDNYELAVSQIVGGSWCRYLLLDDVGTEPVAVKTFGNETYPFVRVVEARYDRKLPMIITSNLAPGDFLERYGIRTHDRMREMCQVVGYSGESFRGQ